MILKRKRSDSEISSSSCLASSPLSTSNIITIGSFQSIQNQIQERSIFSSRTRKRHRDNRPDESIVHQRTLSLLFSAQRNAQPQSNAPSPIPSEEPIASLPTSAQYSGRQPSLHSFWATANSRQSSPSSNSSTSLNNTPTASRIISSYFQVTNCEECEGSLRSGDNGDAIDVDMMTDIDMSGHGADHACSGCGRQVCQSCVKLGSEGKCLICAGGENK